MKKKIKTKHKHVQKQHVKKMEFKTLASEAMNEAYPQEASIPDDTLVSLSQLEETQPVYDEYTGTVVSEEFPDEQVIGIL